MADKANKLICVDSEVFALIKKVCKDTGCGKPNDLLRISLGLPPKKFKVGRPPKPID